MSSVANSESNTTNVCKTCMPPFPNITFTLTSDLLFRISIGIIYSSMTIYLPSLKLLGQSVFSNIWFYKEWETGILTDMCKEILVCPLLSSSSKKGGGLKIIKCDRCTEWRLKHVKDILTCMYSICVALTDTDTSTRQAVLSFILLSAGRGGGK